MICSSKTLKSFRIVCEGNDVAKVEDILFDDSVWLQRYLVAGVGPILTRKHVLVSPQSIIKIDWERHFVELNMSRGQLENSPGLASHGVVSQQEELQHYRYFKWPYYWTGAGTFGVEGFPEPAGTTIDEHFQSVRHALRLHDDGDQIPAVVNEHLKSCKEIFGYRIHATNGVFGHIEDFIFDQSTWKIQWVLVNPRNWWLSKPVRLAPREVEEISRERGEVFVRSPKERIVGAPYSDSNFSL